MAVLFVLFLWVHFTGTAVCFHLTCSIEMHGHRVLFRHTVEELVQLCALPKTEHLLPI